MRGKWVGVGWIFISGFVYFVSLLFIYTILYRTRVHQLVDLWIFNKWIVYICAIYLIRPIDDATLSNLSQWIIDFINIDFYYYLELIPCYWVLFPLWGTILFHSNSGNFSPVYLVIGKSASIDWCRQFDLFVGLLFDFNNLSIENEH